MKWYSTEIKSATLRLLKERKEEEVKLFESTEEYLYAKKFITKLNVNYYN